MNHDATSLPINCPLVSIILPVYNVAPYLQTCLDSLLQLSLENIEIIAIDDCSTDNSLQILHQNAREDARIRVITASVNGGISRTRNKGIQSASGRWIAFVDSDDYLHPETLYTWYQQAENHQVDFLLGNGFRFDEAIDKPWAKTIRCDQEWPEQQLSGAQWIISAVEQNKWSHFAALMFVRRDFLFNSRLLFQEDLLHEDILMTMSLALAAQRVTYCNIPFYGYRQRQGSIVNNSNESMLIHRIKSYLIIIEELINTALKQKDGKLRRALIHHSVSEVGVVLGLLRKKIQNRAALAEAASSFLAHKLARHLILAASNLGEICRIIKFYYVLKKYARG